MPQNSVEQKRSLADPNVPFWQDMTPGQQTKFREVLIIAYGSELASKLMLVSKVITYPTTPDSYRVEEAHTNLLSVYMANTAYQISQTEQHQTGSFVLGVNYNDRRVIFFAEAGIGSGRYLNELKDTIIRLNKNLKSLTGNQNLIPSL